jgi:hypothetical protein
MLMMNLHWSQSAREMRLIDLNKEYVDQWWNETREFQVVEPGTSAGGKAVTSAVNGVGKILVGASTIIDRGIDTLTNPQRPQALREGDLLPRTQRDFRYLYELVMHPVEAIKHPIGTVISSGMRIMNATTSLATDGIQKLGGGKTNSSYHTSA